jgi:hypothetical protein
MGERARDVSADGDDARAAYDLWCVLRKQVAAKSGPDYVVAMLQLYRQCAAITKARRPSGGNGPG